MPAPVQLPALAWRGRMVLALGGLDAADTSVATVTRVLPAPARPAGTLPQPMHDAGAAALGSHVYEFGGGTAAGSLDSIVEVGSGVVGHLPAPASDLEAVPVGGAILIVGGYTGAQPLRSVLSYTPGRRIDASPSSRTHCATRPPRPRLAAFSSWPAAPTACRRATRSCGLTLRAGARR